MKNQTAFILLMSFLLSTSVSCRSKAFHEKTAPVAQTEAPSATAHAEPAHPATAEHAAPHSAHHAVPAGVPPDQALTWLKNGNTRFVKNHLRKDGQNRSDIVRLAKGQQPHTIVLSCSDSRVPPENVFDQKLGEIFVIRTAGEALDHNVIASIEYAVAHLGSRHLLVMGHTQCGAVKAALATIDGGDAGSPSLNHLVKGLHPHFTRGPASADVGKESLANARGIAAELVEQSAMLKEAVASGKLKIGTALYHLNSGVVEFD
jgi:carbonic anhydrase